MIFSKTYIIFMVAIFILSLGKLNAWFRDKIKDAIKKRSKCFDDITFVFSGDDLREHVKTAIDYIERKSRKTCYLALSQSRDSGDINAYYSSFEKHLHGGDIPNTRDFCNQFREIVETNPDLCVEFLNDNYSSDTSIAIKKLVYDYRYRKFPGEYTLRVDKLETINIPLEYYETMKRTFGLNTGEGGMLGPEDFCNERYPMPRRK